MGKTNYVVGLDVGTSKVSACIGQLNDNNQIQIIGVGEAVSEGVKHGMITDLERATKAVSKAIEEAEKISGIPYVMDAYRKEAEEILNGKEAGRSFDAYNVSVRHIV